MTFGAHVEVGVAAGAVTINGDGSDSRFLFGVPVLILPAPAIGIELRPAWAEHIQDYDAALLLGWRFASVKIGYRWVESPHESLSGPYAGLSLRL